MSMPIRQSPIYIFEISTKLIARDIPDCRRKVYEEIVALLSVSPKEAWAGP